MFYFTDFVYQDLNAFGTFEGAKNSCYLLYSNVTVLYKLQKYGIWNNLYDPLPSVPFHTTANTLNAFPPGGFCKLSEKIPF